MTEPPATDATPLPAEPQGAQVRLDAILSDHTHPYNVEGHRHFEAAAAEVLALRRSLLGGANRTLASYREEGDGAPAPKVDGGQPLEPARPPGVDPQLVGDFEAALIRSGLSRHTATMFLGVLDEERGQGTLGSWTEATGGAYLDQKYGPAEADQYIEDAQRAAALLPASVKAWLRSSGAHANPRLIVEAATLWRRRQVRP